MIKTNIYHAIHHFDYVLSFNMITLLFSKKSLYLDRLFWAIACLWLERPAMASCSKTAVTISCWTRSSMNLITAYKLNQKKKKKTVSDQLPIKKQSNPFTW